MNRWRAPQRLEPCSAIRFRASGRPWAAGLQLSANKQNLIRVRAIRVRVDKREVPEERARSITAINRFDFDGLVMKQVRHRARRATEKTRCGALRAEDGFSVDYQNIVPNADFSMSPRGKWSSPSRERRSRPAMTAYVKIPNYSARAFRARGRRRCMNRRHDALARRDRGLSLGEAVQDRERLQDKAYMGPLLHRHDC